MATLGSDPLNAMKMMVECPKCLYIFTDPVSLNNCSHTICQMCYEELPVVIEDERLGIKCPECLQFNRQGDYKKDFKMNQLIEVYKKMEMKKPACGICDTIHTEWSCADCEINLCQGCKDAHINGSATKDHVLELPPLVDNNNSCDIHQASELKFYCLNCLEYICQICKDTSHEDHKQETVLNKHRLLQSRAEELIDSVQTGWDYYKKQDEYLEDQHRDLNNRCDELLIKYEDEMKRLMDIIQKQWEKTKQIIDQIKSDNVKAIQTVSDLKKTEMKHKMALIDLTKATMANANGVQVLNVLEKCIQKLQQEAEKPLSVALSIDVSIPVFTQNPHIIQDAMLLTPPCVFKETRPKDKKDKSVRSWDYAVEDVMGAIGEKVQELELMGNPSKLNWVNENIWLASRSDSLGCEVFNTSDNTLMHISLDMKESFNAFWQTSDNEIVASAKNGLYSLNSDGKLKYKISDKSFTDICSTEDTLVALQYFRCDVHIFKRSNEKWVSHNTFTIDKADRRLKHIFVKKGVVYISYNWTDKIYKFSLAGDFLEICGSTRGNAPGYFSGPYVSGSDCHQALIVCDANNERIQVRKSDGDWREYRLPEGIRRLNDILVVKQRLYVLWDKIKKDKVLTTYKLNLL